MELLIFPKEKCYGIIKGRSCSNGRIKRYWMNKEKVSIQTVALESVILTSVIDTNEKIEVEIVDIPNAFIQTDNQPSVG